MNDKYRELLDRIVKGAEFISSIDESHPQWKDAHERYDQLCDEARRMQHERKTNPS